MNSKNYKAYHEGRLHSISTQKNELLNKLILAVQISTTAHMGQLDKSGKDYIYHPMTVSFNVKGIEAKIVAILHDVCEDTYITVEDLKKYGFSKEIIDAVDLLTKKENVDYEDYIANIKSNELARLVKIQDIRHNSDISRLYGLEISEKFKNKLKKYKLALEFLES